MAQTLVGRGLLGVLIGSALAFSVVACADGEVDGSTEGTTSPGAPAAESPTAADSGSPSTGAAAPGGADEPVSDGGTPVPDGASPSPDAPVTSTPGGGGSPPSTGTVAPIDRGYPTVEAAAPIESVDVLVMESFPPQYSAHIVSGLPSGCASFLRAEVVERSGTRIRIEVVNTVPAPNSNVACTMIYGMQESNVPLGSDFDSGVTYTLEVNDNVTEFTAQ